MKSLLELVIILAATQWPLLVLAGRLDSDELTKFISAAGSVSVIAVYRAWGRRKAKRQRVCRTCHDFIVTAYMQLWCSKECHDEEESRLSKESEVCHNPHDVYPPSTGDLK